MSDHQTLSVYDAKIDDYRALVKEDPAPSLLAFIEAVGTGRVLDLGCGPGHAAAVMAQSGLETDAWDLSSEMVKAATRDGVTARQAGFDDLTAEGDYAGIYASFSLLHAAKSDFPRHLAAISRALQPAGIFHLGMKLGTGEARDPLGRFYAYYSQEELFSHLKTVGLTPFWHRHGETQGLHGGTDPFLLIQARKNG